jgi:type III secretion system YscI/HrpB-like protein
MVTPVLVSATAATVGPVSESARAAAPAKSVEAFTDAMARQVAQQTAENSQVAQAQQAVAPASPPPTSPGQASTADLDAQSRARRGLELDGSSAVQGPETGGDMILNGLQKLRGVFDTREARFSELMSHTSMDAGTMMAMQMEVTNFSLLVDMTSKLTGKSTQAFDTLMKGQ